MTIQVSILQNVCFCATYSPPFIDSCVSNVLIQTSTNRALLAFIDIPKPRLIGRLAGSGGSNPQNLGGTAPWRALHQI